MKTILTTLALCLCLAGLSIAQTVPAQSNQDLGTFLSLSSKRSDLRVNISRVGVDAAYSDWLRATDPATYKAALAKSASTNKAKSNCCVNGSDCCGSCCKSVKADCCTSGSDCCNLSCCGTNCCCSGC